MLAGVAAVVNVSPSISGRYPNLGPEIIVAAGIPLLDDVGPDVFTAVRDGDRVRVDEGVLYVGNTQRMAVKGTMLTIEDVELAMADARAGLSVQIEAFAANTIEFLRRERDLLLDGIGVPDIRTEHRRPSGADGRPRLPLPRGPADAAPVHPRVSPDPDRGRRRRRCPAGRGIST